ncbi:MAG TPA: type II secretion system F family protein [Jatrophihabitantaceae bacterium]|nr:type II secretion system F family protein [Jatrophihabitantaceae bacterium]
MRSATLLVAAELDAGSRPDVAVDAAAAAVPEYAGALRIMAAASERGRSAVSALAETDLLPVARAWDVARRSGSPLADVLRRVAADLAAQIEQHRRVDAALAGPRASALVLAGLPMLGLALGAALGVHPIDILVGTPAARVAGVVGLLLNLAGVLWTRRILRTARRP